jgi:hypothetical protein
VSIAFSTYGVADAESIDSTAVEPRTSVGPFGWRLFILLNATLFLRPAEIISSLEDWPIYQCLILACLAASLPQVLQQIRVRSLRQNAITACVLGLFGCVLLSHLSHLRLYEARTCGLEFFKLVAYYLVFVAVVDSPARLRRFTLWLGVFTIALTGLALLQYHKVIDVPALSAYYERQENDLDPVTGEVVVLARLCGAGIFGNPNDMSRILVVGIMICLYCVGDRHYGMRRWLWASPAALLGYALHLTASRGGLLAFLAGITALLAVRLRWVRTLLLGLVAVPIVQLAFAGRQTDITTDTGTGQQRILIWSEGFELWKQAPLLGIGMHRYEEELGYVAHNSFIQCFTELGFLGGTLFVGAFYLSLRGLAASANRTGAASNDEMQRLGAYLMAIIAGAVVGMLSSTRSYSIPTYILFGVGAAYIQLAGDAQGSSSDRVEWRLARRLVIVSGFVVVSLYLYMRFAIRH